jgi:hypothetical protein
MKYFNLIIHLLLSNKEISQHFLIDTTSIFIYNFFFILKFDKEDLLSSDPTF